MAESGPDPGSEDGSAAQASRLASLLAELKRRGVVRAVAGYGLFAFAVLQVTEPLLHALRLPDGWLTGVVVLLALGFPLTAALSWAFDLTRRGIVRTADAAPAALGAARSPWLAQAGVVVLAAALGAVLAWLALRTPAPVADADGRISVAVADFANETRDPDLDGLSGLLITSLEQSRKLRVVTRARMIDLTRQLGKEAAERIDEALAREVGRKAGVRALLVASIRKLGEAYTAELKALDPQRDEYLFTLREQARSKDELLPLIDRLSDSVRLRLREGEREVRASDIRVAEAITPSLEAYRAYFKGKEAFARMDFEKADAAYREALELEPRFAMAQYELALGATLMAGRDKALLGEAMRNTTGAPEKEGGLIRTLAALHDRRFRDAVARAKALVERFPEDADVLYLAENVLSWAGDLAPVVPLLERLQRVSPDFNFSRLDYVYLLFMMGRADEGRAFVARTVEREPSPGAAVVRGLSRALVGDLAAANADFQGVGAAHPLAGWFLSQGLAASGQVPASLAMLEGAPGPLLELARAGALAFGGRLREADDRLRAAAAAPEADPEQVGVLRFWLLAASGDATRARGAMSAREMVPAWDMLAYFQLGDDVRLAAIRPQLDPGWTAGRLLDALLAWRAGRRGEALERLRALNRDWSWLVPYYRGMAAAEEGLHAEAVEALGGFERTFFTFMDGPFHPWLQARARLQLARSLDALGRREEGRRYVELQLDRWKQADPDLPLLAEARAVCRQVGCKAP